MKRNRVIVLVILIAFVNTLYSQTKYKKINFIHRTFYSIFKPSIFETAKIYQEKMTLNNAIILNEKLNEKWNDTIIYKKTCNKYPVTFFVMKGILAEYRKYRNINTNAIVFYNTAYKLLENNIYTRRDLVQLTKIAKNDKFKNSKSIIWLNYLNFKIDKFKVPVVPTDIDTLELKIIIKKLRYKIKIYTDSLIIIDSLKNLEINRVFEIQNKMKYDSCGIYDKFVSFYNSYSSTDFYKLQKIKNFMKFNKTKRTYNKKNDTTVFDLYINIVGFNAKNELKIAFEELNKLKIFFKDSYFYSKCTHDGKNKKVIFFVEFCVSHLFYFYKKEKEFYRNLIKKQKKIITEHEKNLNDIRLSNKIINKINSNYDKCIKGLR